MADGSSGPAIIQKICPSMVVGNHNESLAPLFIMQTLGKYEMILGLGWMEAHGVLLDPDSRTLYFKPGHCTHPQAIPKLPAQPLVPTTEDTAAPKLPSPVQILRRPLGQNRQLWDNRDALRTMERELSRFKNPVQPKTKEKRPEPPNYCQLLSVNNFFHYLKQPGT